MIGTIGLKDLLIPCVVGIYPHERGGEQPLLVDVEVDQDFASAAASEDVSDTLDYDHLAAGLLELAQLRRYQLIETFAEEAVGMILERWPAVRAARIEIRKPDAVPAADCSFVRLEARR